LESQLKNTGIAIDTLHAYSDFFGTPVPQGNAPEPGVFEWKENDVHDITGSWNFSYIQIFARP
jgi:hypothetical protein